MYYQVHEKPPERLNPDDWMPWINADGDRDQLRCMVARKYLRERRLLVGAREIYLYEHAEDVPRHKETGGPIVVNCIILKVVPEKEPSCET
jgi:hypothetical protein